MPDTRQARPVYRNVNISDLRTYRLPPAGIVSILHRISGLLMVILLPYVLYLFDRSLTSETSFDEFRSVFVSGLGPFPAVLVLIWGLLHHLFAGVRHLYMDATHVHTKEFGRSSAVAVLVAAVVLTLILGAKLFGLY